MRGRSTPWVFFSIASPFFKRILTGNDIGELRAELVSAIKEEVAKIRGLTPLPSQGLTYYYIQKINLIFFPLVCITYCTCV